MVTRSNRRDVRNPILALPAFQRLQALPPEAKAALAAALTDLGLEARRKADQSWAKSKPPMAAYWAATAVYSKHIRRALQS